MAFVKGRRFTCAHQEARDLDLLAEFVGVHPTGGVICFAALNVASSRVLGPAGRFLKLLVQRLHLDDFNLAARLRKFFRMNIQIKQNLS